jgi:hypothetical protein
LSASEQDSQDISNICVKLKAQSINHCDLESFYEEKFYFVKIKKVRASIQTKHKSHSCFTIMETNKDGVATMSHKVEINSVH